ncbi:MAG: SpoIIE family protein phosphatase [Tepidisphaeraceae bacterium]
MEQSAKRFATRILVSHLLLLVVVIAVVLLATRSVYDNAREQAKSQAIIRQELLARQTARGIETFYDSLLADLDLIKRAEEQSTAAATTNPGAQQIGSRTLASSMTATLWDQLQGRITHLFAYDRATHKVTRRFGDEDKIGAERIVDASRAWVDQVAGPDVSGFLPFGDGLNLVAVPVNGPEKRLLIAAVPMRVLQGQFLTDVNIQDEMSAMLLDETAKVMANPDASMVGKSLVEEGTDPRVRDIAREYIDQGKPGTEIFDHEMRVGDTILSRAVTTMRPVTLPNKKWWLVISSQLAEVDAVVNTLFRKAVFWAIFVVVSMTAILVSTAIQLIRDRVRLERVKHELLTKELTQAREIQLAWLPQRQGKHRLMDIAAINQPASHISGDFYNWFELPDGRTVVVIGDVTGHGIAAAFLMSTTQLMVRTIMMRVADPGKCLEEVNRHLCVQVFNGQFVTMLVMVIDLDQNEAIVAAAGHPGPLVGEGEAFEPMPVHAQLVLGVEESMTFPNERIPISPNSSMLLYTDGAIDVQAPDGSRFSIERLQRSLYGRFDNAQDLLDAATDAVNDFRHDRELSDDLTFVAIQLQTTTADTEPTAATA